MKSVCCLIVIMIVGVMAVQAAPPPNVADFTIVGPLIVISGEPFQIDVIENDDNWRPIAPGDTSTIFLSAWDNDGNPVPISPVSFVASGQAGRMRRPSWWWAWAIAARKPMPSR